MPLLLSFFYAALADASPEIGGGIIVSGVLVPIVGALLYQLKKAGDDRAAAEREKDAAATKFEQHLQTQIAKAEEDRQAHLAILTAIKDELRALNGRPSDCRFQAERAAGTGRARG